MVRVLELPLSAITTLGSRWLLGCGRDGAGPLAGTLAAGLRFRAPRFLHFRLVPRPASLAPYPGAALASLRLSAGPRPPASDRVGQPIRDQARRRRRRTR